jgi:hemoglobin/transferrin/lactoferrin receptor protein
LHKIYKIFNKNIEITLILVYSYSLWQKLTILEQISSIRMRKHTIIISLLIFFIQHTNAQIITVRDASTRQPLEYVSVYNVQLKTTTLTNPNGQASVSLSDENDSLYLSLLGYEPQIITYSQLNKNKNRVYLQPGPVMLQPFEVSAIRWQQGHSVSPEHIQVIRPADIAFQNPQTAADMLNSSGHIFVQKSQLGGGSPMIRGFAANRLLIVVDGVRMNNAIFRSGNLQNVISVDPFNIERAEVIFGPGSVAFGSDAIGGVMSFSTFEPGLSATDKPQVYGKALTRWSSANNEKTGQLNLNFAFNKWAFLTVVGVSDFDDLKMGKHGPDEYLRPHYVETVNGVDSMFTNTEPRLQKFSGYSSYNLMQKVRFKPNKKLNITYSFIYNTTSDFPRYDRLIEYQNDQLRSAEWYYGPQKWMMNSVNIMHKDTNKLYDKAVYTIAYQQFEESRNDRRFNNTWLRTQIEQVSVFSANLDFSKQLTKQGILLYGTEAMLNTVGSEAYRTQIESGDIQEIGTRYPDGSQWNSFAAYSLFKQKIGDKINIPIGIRYSHIFANSQFDTTYYPFPFTESILNTGTMNGSVGMVYRHNEHWQLTTNLTSGFRAPNIDDMGKVFDSEPGSVVVPNPNLKPEYAYSGEIGITHIIGEFARIDATGFYTYLTDALVRRDFQLNGADSIYYDAELSRVQAIQNAAFAQVYGFSANLEVKLPAGFVFYGVINWQKGEEELEDGSLVPLRHAAPLYGLTKLSYNKNKFRTELVFLFNGEISHKNLAPSEREKPHMYISDFNGNPYSPAWQTVNLRCAWQFTPSINLTAAIENVFDKRYRTYSSGITAPGRNIILSLQANF